MIIEDNLKGSWIYDPDKCPNVKKGPKTVFHFVGNSTYVMEIDLDEGLMVTWFQYWFTDKGIIRYPLSEHTRAMYNQGEEQVLTVSEGKLIVDGFLMTPLCGRAIPPQCDFIPGSKLDEHGNRVPKTFRSKLLPPIDKPPIA